MDLGGKLISVGKASERDLQSIWAIDGHTIHQRFLSNAVKAGQCWAAGFDDVLAGFAVLDQSFYEQGFLALLSVHPGYCRRGIATALISHAESVCPTAKFFTSTNQSNLPAQKLFESLGFIRNGCIDNLDEGDPEVVYFKKVR